MEEKSNYLELADNHPYKGKFAAPIVAGLLIKGDEALACDDWDSAENCFIAALFCNGGKGRIINAKLDFVLEVQEINRAVADYNARISTAQFSRKAIHVLYDEFQAVHHQIVAMREEMPHSSRIAQLEAVIGTAITQVQALL